MKWENLNRDWFFKKGQVRVFPGNDADILGKKVNLPHDYMIESDVHPDAPAGPAMGYYTEGATAWMWWDTTIWMPTMNMRESAIRSGSSWVRRAIRTRSIKYGISRKSSPM